MKSSLQPPMYLLVATVLLLLGAIFEVTGDSAQSARPTDRTGEPSAGPPVAELPVAELRETDAAGRDASSSPLLGTREAVADHDESIALAGQLERTGPVEPAGPVERAQADQKPDAQTSDSKPPSVPVLKSQLGNVEIFPASNAWNQDISTLPAHPQSSIWLRSIGLDKPLHPDFGTVWRGAPIGIPFVIVPSNYPKQNVEFEYLEESDAGPYPIPPNPPIEGGPDAPFDSDRHLIMIDPQNKRLYELFNAIPNPLGGWRAGSGAIFDLSTNTLRPDGWTSADAAGLPVFPGLVRYDEVAEGEIRHALRFTVARTQRAYIFPARHFASRSTDPNLPPMGLRVRLRADYDVSGFPPKTQVILRALKKYGMLLADNGSDWFISGAPDARWNDDELSTMKRIKGRDLECVLTGPLIR